MKSTENNNESFLILLFWLLSFCGLGIIGWKFFACQEEPMETKVIYVFSTFLAASFLFRWIRKKSSGVKIEKWTREAIEWSDTGVSAVLLAFLIMAFLIQAFKIPSGSMRPTLEIGDHLFVNKFIYGTQIPFTSKKLWDFKQVKRFDVVVFLCPLNALSEEERKKGIKKDFIKRAIGLPGDNLEIKNKMLFINGKKMDDIHGHFLHPTIYPKAKIYKDDAEYQKNWENGDFIYLPAEAIRDNFGPIKVPEKHFFVMGDNRDGSFDSRFWGPLSEKQLKGRAWLLYWPFTRFKIIN